MKRRLTEPQAWREIARRVAARGLQASGLCYEVSELADEGVISDETYLAMGNRVQGHLAAMTPVYAYPEDWSPTRIYFDAPYSGVESRVLAALFLALDAEDDA